MTLTHSGVAPASTLFGRGAFGRLERELLDLGFEPVTATEDTITVFRSDEIAAGGGESTTFEVVFDRRPCMATATIIPGGARESCGPRITLTSQVPAVTQIVALYGALNPDPVAAVESIACTYQLKPWSEGAVKSS
ncbi:hypothetical protein R8Z50_22760 [Longispora sp. K20-0274]|uniref:hypothetical protein n=1 Tax=Longispora sp. K20-0274 TaxID=3088255 RepID=UPI00399BC20E